MRPDSQAQEKTTVGKHRIGRENPGGSHSPVAPIVRFTELETIKAILLASGDSAPQFDFLSREQTRLSIVAWV